MRATLWISVLILFLLGMAAPTTAQPAPPAIHAASAIVVDARTGAVLYAKDPDRRLPPASTTKMLTALLLAQSLPPDASVSISPAAAATPGSDLGVHPGAKIEAKDLLYAILLISANDASAAAAERVGGSTPAFVARMNAEARKMGTANTHFVNPHGLETPDHYASARDLAQIARQAIRNPLFDAAVRTRTYPMPGGAGRPPTTLTNTNTLLWTVEGMDGIKTGYTKEAGRCFVGSATRKGRRIITVVLNSPDWQGETAALLNYGFQIPDRGPVAGTGAHAPATPAKSGTAPSSASQSTSPQTAGTGSGAPAPPSESTPSSENAVPEVGGVENATPGKAHGHGAPQGPAGMPVGPRAYLSGAAPPGTPTGGVAFPPSPPGGVPHQKGSVSAPRRPDPLLTKADPRRTSGSSDPKRTPSPGGTNTHTTHTFFTEGTNGRGLWLFLFLLFLLLLFAFWLSRRRKGAWRFPMTGFPFSFSKRKQAKSSPGPQPDASKSKAAPAAPPAFRFTPPILERKVGRDWLETLLETPTRLMEPALRRQACALLDADPTACIEKILGMLAAPSAKLRLIAAELLALQSPRRAEETLQTIIEEDRTPSDIRSEAIQQLADLGGDRHERLWMQMLVRDGSAPAAHALTALPRLEPTTTQALRHVLATKPAMEKGGDTELKGHLRNAHIACVLGAHGAPAADEEIQNALSRLPANHRDQALVSTLRGVDRSWAIDRLVETALHGHAYPALQALMECDPAQVRSALTARMDGLEGGSRTRALIAQWLLLGEGDPKKLRQFADAGDSLATGALNLGKTHRWEPSTVAPDALLAAAMIVSLRLGFSRHTPEEIATAFRGAASGEGAEARQTRSQELGPLTEAYANPDVYDAVQMAMHTEDGITALLAAMARHPENAAYQQEMAFWLDKTPRDTRLLLTHALSVSDSPQVRTAIEARTADSCPGVRAAAQRSLHARPITASSPSNTADGEEKANVSASSLDQAA